MRSADLYRIIVLPAQPPERRKQLELKRQEYTARLPPNSNFIDHVDLAIRIQLLDRLLRTGLVDPMAVLRETLEAGYVYHLEHFRNACTVVRDYAETGGTNLLRGGLPPVK